MAPDNTAEAAETPDYPDKLKTYRDLSKKLRTLNKYGDEAFDKKNYGYAVEMYRRVLKREPAAHEIRDRMHEAQIKRVSGKPNAFARFWIMTVAPLVGMYNENIHFRKDEYNQAMDLGEGLRTIDPTSAAAARVVGDAALQAEVYTAGIMAMEQALKYNPKSVGTMNFLAQLYGEAGRGTDCLRMYQQCQSLQPRNDKWQAKVREASALASMERGKWNEMEKGESDFTAGIRDKDQAAVLEQEGRSQATEEGRAKLIEAQLQKVQAEDTVANRRRLAELYANDEQYENALEWYRKSMELSDVSDPGVERIMTELRCKKIDQQIQEVQQQVADGSLDQAAADQQITQLQQEQTQIRLNDYGKTLRKFPNNHEVRFEYAQLLASQGEHDEALQHFQKVQNNPRFKNAATMFVAKTFAAKGVYDLAVEQFEGLIADTYKMDDIKKEAYYELGKAYEALDRPDDARKCYKEIYQVDVGYRDVRERIEQSG